MKNKMLGVFATLFIIATVLTVVFFPTSVVATYNTQKLDISEYHLTAKSIAGISYEVPTNVNTTATDGGTILSSKWLWFENEIFVPENKKEEENSITQVEKEISKIKAEYTDTIYENELPKKEAFKVTAVYSDGTEDAMDFEVDLTTQVTQDTVLTIHTVSGDAEVTMHPISIREIDAVYNTKVLEGDAFDKSKLQVATVYQDGYRKNTSEYEVDAPEIFSDDCTLLITAHGLSKDIPIHVSKVVTAKVEGATNHKTGQKPGIKAITMIFDDGSLKTIPRNEIRFKERLTEPMKVGANEYHFEYNEKEYCISVQANSTTLVEDAVSHFSGELDLADYTYVSDSIFVTITKHIEGDARYFLSHIVVNDPTQLRSGLSYGDYGGERELPTEAAKRLKWVIGTNGSNFNYATGTPEYAGVCIKNRQVMEGSRTNGMEICLMSTGVLFSPAPGVDPRKLIASDVIDSWSCGDTLLIDDGYAVNVGIQSEQYRYPRTAIGMVQPCEYYIITAGDGNYKGGMTYDEIRDVLMSHGCSYGKCMDGGGSSSLVFRGELINTPAVNDTERAVVDFLYFVEDDENNTTDEVTETQQTYGTYSAETSDSDYSDINISDNNAN